MAFEVFVTSRAEKLYREILNYVFYSLENPFAATRLTDEFEKALNKIALNATGYALAENPKLRELDIHIVHFMRNRYVILYHVEGDTAVIDGFYSSLQDYENIIF